MGLKPDTGTLFKRPGGFEANGTLDVDAASGTDESAANKDNVHHSHVSTGASCRQEMDCL
jgi:hypothetical protein